MLFISVKPLAYRILIPSFMKIHNEILAVANWSFHVSGSGLRLHHPVELSPDIM